MDGLFGELDIASANDNPFFKPDGTYLCEISKAEIKTSKAGNKGFTLDYLIVSDEPHGKKDKKIQEWKPIPMPWHLKGFESKEQMDAGGYADEKIKENAARNVSFLKQRLKDFGIPVDQMNSVDAEYLLNKVPQLWVTIQNKDGNERITGVKIAEGESGQKDPFA